jgi:hypothetical protein
MWNEKARLTPGLFYWSDDEDVIPGQTGGVVLNRLRKKACFSG